MYNYDDLLDNAGFAESSLLDRAKIIRNFTTTPAQIKRMTGTELSCLITSLVIWKGTELEPLANIQLDKIKAELAKRKDT